MADIFISYASEDKAFAASLASVLAQRGWSVWWDREIPVGKSFHQVIEEAIEAARCVVVIWSGNSVTSDWVRNEAEEGRRRNVLLPIMIEEVKIPVGFRHLQAARLSDWRPGAPNAEFDRLLASIEGTLGVAPATSKGANTPFNWFQLAELPVQAPEPSTAKTAEREQEGDFHRGWAPAMTPSAALASIVGPGAQTRLEVERKLWDYIEEKKLRDRMSKKMINVDDKLLAVFNGKARVHERDVSKWVDKHLA